jgi:hypothetical protein
MTKAPFSRGMGVSPMHVDWNEESDLVDAALTGLSEQMQALGLTTSMGGTPMPRSEADAIWCFNAVSR